MCSLFLNKQIIVLVHDDTTLLFFRYNIIDFINIFIIYDYLFYHIQNAALLAGISNIVRIRLLIPLQLDRAVHKHIIYSK